MKRKTIFPLIEETIEKESTIHTDELPVYDTLSDKGYDHKRVNHGQEVYVIGDAHTNTIEGFWAQIKNAIRGVHHGVAPHYLQWYVNEYIFRYNHRNDVQPMFSIMHNQITA